MRYKNKSYYLNNIIYCLKLYFIMTFYLTADLKENINNLIINDMLMNLVLYSEETNGKSLTAKYIANEYYKNLLEEEGIEEIEDIEDIEKMYLHLSLSLYSVNDIKDIINSYIKKRSDYLQLENGKTINIKKRYKKIIILDDYYFNNKIINDYLINVISSLSDNIIFIIITRDLKTINEFISSRCLLVKIDKLKPEFYKQIINRQYPLVSSENIEKLKLYFNNSIYNISIFLFYIDKWLSDKNKINDKISEMLNIELFKENKSLIEDLVTNVINKNILRVLEIIRMFYSKGTYADNILNNVLKYTITSRTIKDEQKIIIIEETLKSLYNVYKYTDSILQVNKCFIKIYEKL